MRPGRGRTRVHLHLAGIDAQEREVFDNAKTKDGRPAHPVNLICSRNRALRQEMSKCLSGVLTCKLRIKLLRIPPTTHSLRVDGVEGEE